MIRQKKEIKRVAIVVIFISFIFISNLLFLNHANLIKDNRNNIKNLEDIPNTSNLDLDDYILGSGTDQDVRIYVSNESNNLNDNKEYFTIPSITSDDMFLTYGDFNFSFQNNFTTEYVLEDDYALDASDFISFDLNSESGISYGPGTSFLSGSFNNLVDNSNSTNLYLRANSGKLNFTVKANYTDEIYSNPGVINGNVEFNRTKILGLIVSLLFDLSLNANLTIRIWDYSKLAWFNLTNSIPINSSIGIQEIKRKFINENLNYIDLSSVCYLQFIFKRLDSSSFTGHFYNLKPESTFAFDLPIKDNTYVALEFDLKGDKTNVNGFYAWIRALNLTAVESAELNITLYRADDTIIRTEGNLRGTKLNPDYSDMIDSFLLVNHTQDFVSYFEFNLANTQNLNLSNYFIVIKSNTSNDVYSLVTLPFIDFTADGTTDHQLITTNNDGLSWSLAKKQVDTTIQPYISGQLDATPFRLNVTRGYMPSDFKYEDIITLNIQDNPIANLEISSYPYNESSYLTWGIGRWNNRFSPAIEDSPTNEFEIYLDWNRSVIGGFEFNVTYNIEAYWVEGATSSYNATYNEDPEWVLEYNFDKNSSKFNNWNFSEFWYVYPNYMNARNLTNSNNEEFLWLLEDESAVVDQPNNYKLVINESYTTPDGIFTLNLTSFNFIHDMHSYINYKGILSETNGFMYGDNISVSLDIQDPNLSAPISGDANATLFYPNGTQYSGAELINSSGTIDGTLLKYDFNNDTILDLTDAVTVFGEYQLGFFWLNGSALGCKKITLYIDSYDLELYNLTYSPNLGTNFLIGELNNKVFQNYSMLIASINDTTGIPTPNFYAVNNTDINQEFSYNLGGEDLSLLVKSLLQSEDILNPNEIVNIKTTIQNTHPFIPVDVKIDTKLVSYLNEDWVIAENTSNSVTLNFSGHPDDNYEFDLNLAIPNLDIVSKTWLGVNAPIRLGGAKTIITLYIDDIMVGTYKSPSFSLMSNQTSGNYDGYILGLTIAEEITSKSILYEFERDECLYFPENSSFLVNIIDTNFVSSYRQFNKVFSIKLNSKFTNITINPNTPIKGQIINFSSTLATEFGDALPNKNISCEYYNSGSWTEVDTEITDAFGYATFIIDTLVIDFEGDLLLRLFWAGDIINGISQNVTINTIHEKNSVSIMVSQDDVLIYRNRLTTITYTLTNVGDSNLKLFGITINIENELSYKIAEVNYVELDWLSPGDKTDIVIEITITEISQLKINFTITGQNVITGENITFFKESTMNIFDPPIIDYFIEFFMFIMIAVFVIIWLVAALYARRVRKRIEEPVEIPERRPRKGKYVMVSDLKKPTPEKKVSKKKVEQKEVRPKKTTDLDSLLEERGLADKRKKKKSK
ncbi:MAG: hypothetical protein ACFFD7_04790 [Candidatus Thorarchaeota archaeon]